MDQEDKAELEILRLDVNNLTRELKELRARVIYLERHNGPLEIDDKTLAEAVMEHEGKFREPVPAALFSTSITSRRKGNVR